MERRYVNALMLNACRLIYCRAITATRVKGVLRRLASPCLCEKCEDRCDDRKNCAPIEIIGRRSVEIGDEDRLESATKIGWDRRRESVEIGDEDRLKSATRIGWDRRRGSVEIGDDNRSKIIREYEVFR